VFGLSATNNCDDAAEKKPKERCIAVATRAILFGMAVTALHRAGSKCIHTIEHKQTLALLQKIKELCHKVIKI
jgi:hypothetical protein